MKGLNLNLSHSDQLTLLVLIFIFLIVTAFRIVNQEKGIEVIIKRPSRININTAPLEELQSLPKIGPRLGQRIIEYRKMHGDFRYIEEITRVKGISGETLSRLAPLITVKDGK